MELGNLEYQRELAAFDEKITLAQLETTKALERVDELKYQKARFELDVRVAMLKSIQEQNQGQKVVQGSP
jgi:hypothetical protein